MQGVWATLPGATGQVAVLCMFFMYTTAIDRMRRTYFELFWYTHHLFIIFFGVLMAHGFAPFLLLSPSFCNLLVLSFANLLEPPTFWMWTCGPVALYFLERTIRIIRGSKDTVLLKVTLSNFDLIFFGHKLNCS